MQRGDTFVIKEPGNDLDTHLWVVLSCPETDPNRVLCVNITSSGIPDQSCLLNKEDHRFLSRLSWIEFARPKLVTLRDLDDLLARGLIERRDPMSSEVMDRIYAGAESTTRLSVENADLLQRQGLILTD